MKTDKINPIVYTVITVSVSFFLYYRVLEPVKFVLTGYLYNTRWLMANLGILVSGLTLIFISVMFLRNRISQFKVWSVQSPVIVILNVLGGIGVILVTSSLFSIGQYIRYILHISTMS